MRAGFAEVLEERTRHGGVLVVEGSSGKAEEVRIQRQSDSTGSSHQILLDIRHDKRFINISSVSFTPRILKHQPFTPSNPENATVLFLRCVF